MKFLRDSLTSKLVRGGGVPGGHRIIVDGVRSPHIPTMRECASIPLRPSDVVADIGAYCGTFALRAARFPVLEVRAYEPAPFSFGILATNKNANLRAIPRAVVRDGRDEATFYLSRGIGVTNSLVPSTAKDAIAVGAISYGEAVIGATVVKIDIEGGEYDLGPLVRDSIRALIVDFHPIGPNWIARAEAIVGEIESAGFESIIAPRWNNGWTRAGSWLRDRPDTGLCNESLFCGAICTGCGVALFPTGRLALCQLCYPLWRPKERARFFGGEAV
jgi:FkbM family methyltransferase